MRITTIELNNFRAFYGQYTINLGKTGNNLLVYGENGSGKSSLYHALLEFLRGQNRPIEPFRNLFAAALDDVSIKISLRKDEKSSEQRYEWSTQSNETDDRLIRDAAKSSGFLEYKTLLETYFLPIEDNQINIFSLVMKLIAHIHFGDSRTIGQKWAELTARIPKRNTANSLQQMYDAIQLINRDLFSILADIKQRANDILRRFNYPLEWDFKFDGVAYDRHRHEIVGREIYLDVQYYKKNLANHHNVLNEAKLSALAISLYFAARLQTPRADLNLLVLDDMLIGLDMSNRLPIIDILETYFKDYQIFFFTYDRAWFEMMRLRTQSKGWMTQELYCGYLDGHDFELPIVRGNRTYLQSAEYYLNLNDYKAAVIYLRTAFEELLKKFCSEKRLQITYNLDSNKVSGNDFWQVAKAATDKANNQARYIPLTLEQRIEHHRKFLLNPVSHSAILSIQRKEVEDALNDIRELKQATEKKQSQP